MIELYNRKTGEIIQKCDYDMDYFLNNVYGGMYSVITENGIIIGFMHPEYAWREVKENN